MEKTVKNKTAIATGLETEDTDGSLGGLAAGCIIGTLCTSFLKKKKKTEE